CARRCERRAGGGEDFILADVRVGDLCGGVSVWEQRYPVTARMATQEGGGATRKGHRQASAGAQRSAGRRQRSGDAPRGGGRFAQRGGDQGVAEPCERNSPYADGE